MIPKTRSGKTLRRVPRGLIENATHNEFEKGVQVPTKIDVIDVARVKIKEYFSHKGKDFRSYEQIMEQFWLHKFALCILLLVAVGLELCLVFMPCFVPVIITSPSSLIGISATI